MEVDLIRTEDNLAVRDSPSTRFGVAWLLSKCRRRDGVTPAQDDREDVNAVFMDKYPKAILLESGIALVILGLAKAGVGPLGKKFREEGD